MKRVIIKESSQILSSGYDRNNKLLEIEFKGNSIYQYYNVPQEVYLDFLSDESQGKFFSKYIKNIYKYERVSSVIKAEINSIPKQKLETIKSQGRPEIKEENISFKAI